MVERFFSLNFSHDNKDSIVLLSGPPSSGKTSLVFQYALNSVLDRKRNNSKDDKWAVIICNRRTKPPFLSQGIAPSSHVFDQIQMKYVEDEEGINNFFAAFHLHHTFPVSVIIDDFGDFFDQRNCQRRYNSPRGRDLAIVRTLALCRNAINHANETGSCKLLISDTDTHHGDTPRLLYIYKRWVSSIYTIKGDGSGSFILNNSSCPGLEVETRKTAKYSIALQYLVLQGIYENEQQL